MQLYRSLIFLVCTLLLLLLLDIYSTRSIRQDDYNKVWWAWKKYGEQYDYAILGSSRSLTGVNTLLLDSCLGMNGINLSLDDAQVSSQYLILEKFLGENANKIKVLFLELDPRQLNSSSVEVNRLWCFLPYIHREVVYEHFRLQYPRKALLWKYFPYYRYAWYNSRIGILTVLNSRLHVVKRPFNSKGDRMHNGSFIDTSAAYFQKPYYRIDTASGAVSWLDRILGLADAHGVKVFAFSSPFYYNRQGEAGGHTLFIKELQQLVFEKRAVPFADFSYFYTPDQAAYFYDGKHLNAEGAEMFTPVLAAYFRKLTGESRSLREEGPLKSRYR